MTYYNKYIQSSNSYLNQEPYVVTREIDTLRAIFFGVYVHAPDQNRVRRIKQNEKPKTRDVRNPVTSNRSVWNVSIIVILYITFMILDSSLFPLQAQKLTLTMSICKIIISYQVLGKRIVADFSLSSSLKALFCALITPILKYGSFVWNPHLAVYCQQIERVQRKFLSFVGFKL